MNRRRNTVWNNVLQAFAAIREGERPRVAPQRPAVRSSAVRIMALEPRIMFDGAAMATALHAAQAEAAHEHAVIDKSSLANCPALAVAPSTDSDAASPGARNVVFVDARVQDSTDLLKNVAANTDVVYLQQGSDGLKQMSDYLAQHEGAASVQIIAHGNTGDLWLGNTYLSADTLASHAAELGAIGRDMRSGGDILIYACNTAAGDQGMAFVASIADLTGRDVAASNNRTGAHTDWNLEISVGHIDATPLLSAASESAYDHDLALLTVTSNGDTGAGTLRNTIASATSGDTITFNTGMTVTLSSGQLTINKNLTIDGDLDNNGTADVTINANHTSRVINITSGTVMLDGLVITNGFLTGAGGDTPGTSAGLAGGDSLGAGISNAGTLTITHSTITANKAAGGGGGGGGNLGGGGAGGGGGGFGTAFGGAGGANHGSAGGAGSAGAGGRGAGYSGMGGAGGTTTGGAGSTYGGGYTNGGNGGTANNGSIGIGGGGGGAGYNFAGGRGGNAVGGIYNTGTIVITASTITNNIGAAGGGGGGASPGGAGGNGGDGGSGTGAIWNNGGTVQMDSGTYATFGTTNAGGAGTGGIATKGGSSNGASGTAVAKIATTAGGTTDTNLASITSATYDASTGSLVVTGTGFVAAGGAANDIDVSKLTFAGEGGSTYTLTDSGDVEISSATAFTVTLSATDKAAVNLIVNKNGTSATSGTSYNLAAAEDWDTGVAPSSTIADLTGNGITASNVAVPSITSATYDESTGAVVVTGTGFLSASGAANDIVANKFTFTGEGGSTYTLTDTSNVDIASGTTFTLTLSATDKAAVNQIVNKNGTSSTSGTTYNLAAAEDWAAGAASAVVVADTTGNGVTTSNVAVPAITSATYNASTGALVVTGLGFSSLGGATNDIVANKFTFTGEGGSTYTLTDTANVEITSGTSFTLTLSSTDKTGINQLVNKNGTSSTGGTTYNLAAAEDWAAGADAAVVVADTTGNGVTASNVAVPAITSATYDESTGALVVTGTGFLALTGATNDIVANKFTLTGEGGSTYTLTDTANVEITSSTSFTLTLSATDRAAINQIVNKNGTSSTGGTTYNLAAAEDWAAGADAAVVVADTTGNGVTASNVAVPTITSATYDESTGALVVTGSGFLKLSGATNDIVANKFTFTGEGGSTYTLTDTANVEITSGTSFTLTLSATDKAAINQIVNKNGTSSTSGTTYNLAAAEDWAAGADAAVVVADTSGNGVTASNVAVPAITSATYNESTGALVVTGTGFLSLSGATNDIVANKFTLTGEGGSTFTLTDTANVEITSGTSFTLTLSATDKAAVNLIVNKNGTSSTSGTTYNLAAAEDWAAGADAAVIVADTTGNGITASNVAVPAITSATYDESTGTLVVTGTGFLSLSGATNDIVANKFTLTGEGGATYTLTDTANVEITSGTSFTLTLSATDKAAVNLIANKNGTSSTGGTTYNLAAAEDWAAGAASAVVVADTTGNGVTASNVAVPTITSATYDATTGVLVVTGTDFLKRSGATNDIDVSKLTLSGDSTSYTLTTSSVEITSGTSFTVTLNGTDFAAVASRLNKSGTSSLGSVTYNIAAAEDWAAGADAAVVVADLTGNGISVANVPNAAPVIANLGGDSASYTEGGAAVKLDTGTAAAVTDTDSANFNGGALTVAISAGGVGGEDVLGIDTSGTVSLSAGVTVGSHVSVGGADIGTISSNGSSGANLVVDFNSNATAARTTTLLNAVTYLNSNSTQPNTGNRTIDFTVSDGAGGTSTAASTTAQIVGVNDAPTLSATGGTPTYTENGSAVDLFSGVSVSTVETGQAITQLTLTVSNVTDGASEILRIDGTDFALTNGSSGTSATNGISVSVSVASGTATVTIGKVGGISSAAAATLVDGLSYRNASELPGTTSRVVTLTGIQDDGGTANGGVDTSALSVAATASVVSVNDAPSITAPGSIAITEDVSGALTGISFADVDANGGSETVSLSVGSGTLAATSGSGVTVSGSGTGSMTLSGSIANINAFIAASNVGFTTASNASSNVTLTVGIDDGGNTGTDPGISGTGGSEAASTTVTLAVAAVNDAPVNSVPASQHVPQDASLVFDTGHGNLISIADVDAGSSLMQVTLTSTHGLMTLSGTTGLSFSVGSGSGDATMTFTGTIADVNTALNGLSFAPTAGYNGAASLQITTSDQGSTGSGGTQTDTDTIAVTVDPINPVVTTVHAGSPDGSYKVGDTVTATVTFDMVVNVDTTGGTPTLLLETGSVDRNAVYVSGSGTNTLSFSYTVQPGDASADLDYQSTGALALNGGTIRSGTSLDAVLTLPATGGANSIAGQHGIVIDGVAPVVASVGVPPDATYVAGQNLDFTVNFSEAVTVDTTVGTPRIAVTLDTGGTVYASYLSGSGSSALVFRLTVASGELDSNGVSLGGSVDTNGGTLRDAVGNAAVTTLNGVGATTGVLVDAIDPTVATVGVPASGNYNAGDVLGFTVNTSEAVTVNTTGGTPRLALDIGGSTVYATYVSGSGSGALVFQYVVQPGDSDTNGIAVGALQTNGATLRDAAGNNLALTLNGVGSTTGVLIDTTAPTPSAIVRVDATPTDAASISYTATFSEDVSGVDASDFALVATGTASGSVASVTQVDAHTYTVLVNTVAGTGSLRLDLNASGTGIVDTAGNALAGGLAGAVYVVDRDAPTVASVGVPPNATYVAGQNLDFTVNFNEAVTVDATGGTPRIAVTLDTGGTVYASYLSGSGSSALVFRLTVASGELDSNGVSVASTFDANGGTVRDSLGNNAASVLNGVGATTGVLIDAIDPSVTSVGVPADGVYTVGSVFTFTVNASEAVTVNTSGGTPRLALDIGGATAYASYVSGSGSGALTFQYTLLPGDNAAGGIAVSALQPNGGTMRDAAGNDLVLALSGVPPTTGIVVDTAAPTATSIARLDATPTSTQTVRYTVQFSENVTGVDLSDFALAKQGGAQGDVISVTQVDAHTYTVLVGHVAGSGQIALQLNGTGSGIADGVGNAMTGTTMGEAYVLVPVPSAPLPAPMPIPEPASPTTPVTPPWTAPVTFNPGTPINQIDAPTITLVTGPGNASGNGPATMLPGAGMANNIVSLGPDALAIDRLTITSTPGPYPGFIETGAGNRPGLQALPEIGNFSVRAGQAVNIGLPASTFTHSDRGESITIEVRLSDGRPLPAWLKFDPVTGTLVGQPPAGVKQVLHVEIIARDSHGNRVSSHLDIDVKADAPPPKARVSSADADGAGRSALAAQFDGQGAMARQAERHALLDHLRAAARQHA